MIETKRRGISTFIATLLLMVLAVSAGVVIYAYTMGYLGNFGGPQTLGAVSVDAWSLNTTALTSELTSNVAVNVYIRNIGKTEFICDTVYVNGLKVSPYVGGETPTFGWELEYPESGTSIPEAEVGTLKIYQNAVVGGSALTFKGSTTYDIKLIGKDNTQLSFQVKN